MLADAYEQLRHGVVDRSGRGDSLQGLAIIMRKGMAAWMHACMTAAPAPAAVPPSRATTVPVSPNVQREVVDVLAAMALRTGLEVRT
jgi:hypothetical protein